MIKEFANVKHLCSNSVCAPEMLPSIVTKLYWYHGLEQRMKVSCPGTNLEFMAESLRFCSLKNPMEKFSYLYPNLLQGDLGYQLRDSYKQTLEFLEK